MSHPLYSSTVRMPLLSVPTPFEDVAPVAPNKTIARTFPAKSLRQKCKGVGKEENNEHASSDIERSLSHRKIEV